ncbi:MAG: Hsp70 family protein [Pseudomonadota bacterium]|nr:Hsp70 family protein [Pseudomonadota bacterium]
MRWIWALLLLAGCSGAAEQQVEVEGMSPAVSGSELTEGIGIETLGGVFTPLLERGCALPCEVTQVFSTADDRQTEILIHLFRGTARLVKDAQPLGAFRISGVRALPRGEAQVEVRISVSSQGIALYAREIGAASSVQVTRVAP